MRHKVAGFKLARDTKARKALLKNLTSALFEKGQITTTQAKAKFAKAYVEKLITVAKSGKLSNRRKQNSQVSDLAFSNLINNLAVGFKERKGGYTRIIKLNRRRGDGAYLSRLELLKIERKAEPIKKKQGENVINPV